MPTFRAAWVLPIAQPPVRGGWVQVEGGRIVAVGEGPVSGDVRDLGPVALMPSLVNAHTHLELSVLRGQVPAAPSLVMWVRALLAARRAVSRPADGSPAPGPRAVELAIDEARTSGTGLVGDVSNTLATVECLARRRMPARVFHEVLGFSASETEAALLVQEARARVDRLGSLDETVRVSLAAHAPYSVSTALLQALRADLEAHPHDVSSVHLAESPEEGAFLMDGSGPWRTLLAELGAWPADWSPPALTPVRYLESLGVLDARLLAAHAVWCTADDLARLAAHGVTAVSCPRSNRHVGAGAPPLSAMYRAGVRVAFGTDSLASAPDLNLFTELAEAKRLAPDVSAGALLESATRQGARALGFGEEFGSLAPGWRASLIAVRLAEPASDPGEYLVSGIPPALVSWPAA